MSETYVAPATSYKLDIAEDSMFTSFVSGWEGTDVGLVLSHTVPSGLSYSTQYWARLRGQSYVGESLSSNTCTFTTSPPDMIAGLFTQWPGGAWGRFTFSQNIRTQPFEIMADEPDEAADSGKYWTIFNGHSYNVWGSDLAGGRIRVFDIVNKTFKGDYYYSSEYTPESRMVFNHTGAYGFFLASKSGSSYRRILVFSVFQGALTYEREIVLPDTNVTVYTRGDGGERFACFDGSDNLYLAAGSKIYIVPVGYTVVSDAINWWTMANDANAELHGIVMTKDFGRILVANANLYGFGGYTIINAPFSAGSTYTNVSLFQKAWSNETYWVSMALNADDSILYMGNYGDAVFIQPPFDVITTNYTGSSGSYSSRMPAMPLLDGSGLLTVSAYGPNASDYNIIESPLWNTSALTTVGQHQFYGYRVAETF